MRSVPNVPGFPLRQAKSLVDSENTQEDWRIQQGSLSSCRSALVVSAIWTKKIHSVGRLFNGVFGKWEGRITRGNNLFFSQTERRCNVNAFLTMEWLWIDDEILLSSTYNILVNTVVVLWSWGRLEERMSIDWQWIEDIEMGFWW